MFEVNEYHLEILREAAKHPFGIYDYELTNIIAEQRRDHNAASDRIKSLVGDYYLSSKGNRVALTPSGRSYLEALENRVRLNAQEQEKYNKTHRLARRANIIACIALAISAITFVATFIL